jgi:hypothetical protein
LPPFLRFEHRELEELHEFLIQILNGHFTPFLQGKTLEIAKAHRVHSFPAALLFDAFPSSRRRMTPLALLACAFEKELFNLGVCIFGCPAGIKVIAHTDRFAYREIHRLLNHQTAVARDLVFDIGLDLNEILEIR